LDDSPCGSFSDHPDMVDEKNIDILASDTSLTEQMEAD
jgi:hypothetical protein